jgi:hypothetical protein
MPVTSGGKAIHRSILSPRESLVASAPLVQTRQAHQEQSAALQEKRLLDCKRPASEATLPIATTREVSTLAVNSEPPPNSSDHPPPKVETVDGTQDTENSEPLNVSFELSDSSSSISCSSLDASCDVAQTKAPNRSLVKCMSKSISMQMQCQSLTRFALSTLAIAHASTIFPSSPKRHAKQAVFSHLFRLDQKLIGRM